MEKQPVRTGRQTVTKLSKGTRGRPCRGAEGGALGGGQGQSAPDAGQPFARAVDERSEGAAFHCSIRRSAQGDGGRGECEGRPLSAYRIAAAATGAGSSGGYLRRRAIARATRLRPHGGRCPRNRAAARA